MKKSILRQLIKEQIMEELNSKPKAIFMAGPAGSGKTTILKSLNLSDFTVINIDDIYEELLKTTLGKSSFQDMTPDELSKAGSLMAQARKLTKNKEEELLQNMQNIIIDGVGASSKSIEEKKKNLEALGYDTFMILIYVNPLVSLERNIKRERSLPTSAVLSSWEGVAKNIPIYKNMFGNNIVIIDNNPKDADKSFNPEQIRQMFPMPQGKPKTPEEIAKKKAKAEELNSNIKQLLQINRQFDSIDTLKTKLNNFI